MTTLVNLTPHADLPVCEPHRLRFHAVFVGNKGRKPVADRKCCVLCRLAVQV